MKLTLNTTDKIITVEGSVNLNELITELKKLFQDNQWKEYKLESQQIINLTPQPVYPYMPTYPFNEPWHLTSPFKPFCGTTIDCSNGICGTTLGTTLITTGSSTIN